MRVRLVRFLTLMCFFHFSGLNNGFSFFAVSAGSMQPVSFAPVAIRSVAIAVNPYRWKRILDRRFLRSSVLSSRQVLEVSSRRALRGVMGQLGLIKEGIRAWGLGAGSVGKNFSFPLRVGGDEKRLFNGFQYSTVGVQSAGERGESWLRQEKLDLLKWEHRFKDLPEPWMGRGEAPLEADSVGNRVEAQLRIFQQAMRPRMRQRMHYDAGEDGEGGILNFERHSGKSVPQ